MIDGHITPVSASSYRPFNKRLGFWDRWNELNDDLIYRYFGFVPFVLMVFIYVFILTFTFSMQMVKKSIQHHMKITKHLMRVMPKWLTTYEVQGLAWL